MSWETRRNAERVELMPTLAWRLGPRTVMTSGYDWITEHLIAGERGTMHIGRLGWSRDVTSRTTFTTSYIGRLFVDHVDAVSDYQSHAVLLGMDRVALAGNERDVVGRAEGEGTPRHRLRGERQFHPCDATHHGWLSTTGTAKRSCSASSARSASTAPPVV